MKNVHMLTELPKSKESALTEVNTVHSRSLMARINIGKQMTLTLYYKIVCLQRGRRYSTYPTTASPQPRALIIKFISHYETKNLFSFVHMGGMPSFVRMSSQFCTLESENKVFLTLSAAPSCPNSVEETPALQNTHVIDMNLY